MDGITSWLVLIFHFLLPIFSVYNKEFKNKNKGNPPLNISTMSKPFHVKISNVWHIVTANVLTRLCTWAISSAHAQFVFGILSFEHDRLCFERAVLGIRIIQAPRLECVTDFFYFSTKTYVVGTQKNRLDATVLLSTQNTCLY